MKRMREAECQDAGTDAHSVCPNDIIGINIGGELTIQVRRSLMTQFPGTHLAHVFSEQSHDDGTHDSHGNYFFDESPKVIMPVIDWLREVRDATPGFPAQPPSIAPQYRTSWVRMMIRFGFTARELRHAGLTSRELKSANYTAKALKLAGFSCDDLAQAGFDAHDVGMSGFDLSSLRKAGYGVKDLREIGATLHELNELGISGEELRSGGFNAEEFLREFGVENLRFLKSLGFNAVELRSAGCTLRQFVESDFTPEELRIAFSKDELAEYRF